MPLNKSLKKVMVIGSGPIVIGQAAEFDYAGTQACRALERGGSGGCAGKLQPGNHHDGQRHGGSNLHRAADSGYCQSESLKKNSRTAFCPPWADRRG